MKRMGREIKLRLPRLIMNVVMALIFFIISIFVPPPLSNIEVPGLNIGANQLVWIVSIFIMAIFLVRALSDALILGDAFTDVVIRRLGIKEERSPKRALRDFIYIIVIILVATALAPFLASIKDVGGWLSTANTYIALALIIILIYDIGRILYHIVEEKAELLAEKLVRPEKTKARKADG